jgi:hypothetical protein
MSEDQNSNIILSSLYDDTDSVLHLASDPPQLFTPELSGSQRTFDLLDQDFIQPRPRLSIPSSLKRVGPDRRKNYVLYDRTMHSEWVDWWLETGCGKISKIRWDANHQAESWQHFDQVADSSDGQPKVMCKRCGLILEHPSSTRTPGGTNRHGTSTLIKHLRTTAYQQRARNSQQGANITRFLQVTVSAIIFKI